MRPSWDEKYLQLASSMAEMGTCVRRQVGCFLVDQRRRVVGTGVNGVPPNFPHCRELEQARCPGADAASGTRLEECRALHAEQNALSHCFDRMQIHTCYTTTSPCINCVKELLHTSCCRIVFLEEYPQPEARALWTMQDLTVKTRLGPYTNARTWEIFSNVHKKAIVQASSSGKH